MTDTLLHRFLPNLRGYIVNNYAWVEERYGKCLYSIDDLTQIATIELIKLSRDWTPPADITTRSELLKVAYGNLKTRVKNAILNDLQRNKSKPEPGDRSFQDVHEDLDRSPAEVIVARRSHSGLGPWAPDLTHRELCDYFDVLPRRDKVYLALRYFDELTFEEMASLLESEDRSVSGYVGKVIARFRQHACNLRLDHPTELPPRKGRPWDPPASLAEYIQSRWQADLPTYLGHVTRSFRADAEYLTEILSEQHKFTSGSFTYEPARIAMWDEIDRLLTEGHTQAEIARRLGVSQSTVSRVFHRRAT